MSEADFERGFVSGWEAAKRQHMKSVAEAEKWRQNDQDVLDKLLCNTEAAKYICAKCERQQYAGAEFCGTANCPLKVTR